MVVHYVASSGSWLDEYWHIHISGAPADMLGGRLLADAHPPWFNLLARPLVLLSGGNVLAARLASLAGALILLGFGLRALGNMDRGIGWRIFLLTIASAGATGFAELSASFRVYPWLLALAALQAAILLLAAQKRAAPPAMVVAVTAASIALHYVHAAGAIAIALVTAFLAWRGGDRRLFGALALGAATGIALDLASGLTQMPHWRANLDVNWIALAGGGGPAVIGESFAGLLLFNLVAAGLIVLGALRCGARAAWLWLFAPLPVALAAWLAMDLITPLLMPRYFTSITALWAVAAAAAWQSLAPGRTVQSVIALLAALQPLVATFLRPPLPGWEAGAAAAAPIVAACPSTRLLAVNAWRFRDRPDSRAAVFEAPVFRLAYRRVAERFGLAPIFVDRPVKIAPRPCPIVIWVEAAHGLDQASPATVLARARITVPAGSTTRFVATPNGALLIVTPIPNPQSFALQGRHGRP